jgi:hypothetical protein
MTSVIKLRLKLVIVPNVNRPNIFVYATHAKQYATKTRSKLATPRQ